MPFVLLVLAIVVSSAGCSPTVPLVPDGGSDASATPDTPVDGGLRRDGGECLEATLGPWAYETYDDAIVVYRARITPSIDGDPFDLFIETRRIGGVLEIGTFPLGEGNEANYGTCSECVVSFTGSIFDHGFYARSGTLVLEASPWDLQLRGSLDDVTLEEVTIADDQTSTPVPNGDCIHLARADFDVTFGPPGWTCDEAAFSDGTTCDCDCGIFDPDCHDVALPSPRCTASQVCLQVGPVPFGPFGGDSVCAERCGPGEPCTAGVCADSLRGPVCIEDETLIDRDADVGQPCSGAVTEICAVDAEGNADGYCDRGSLADGRCRPACSTIADCDRTTYGHCYVRLPHGGPGGAPTGYCVPGVPTYWTCDDAAYADGTTCDCGCLEVDPDCDDPTLPVNGCATGEVCMYGSCSAP